MMRAFSAPTRSLSPSIVGPDDARVGSGVAAAAGGASAGGASKRVLSTDDDPPGAREELFLPSAYPPSAASAMTMMTASVITGSGEIKSRGALTMQHAF